MKSFSNFKQWVFQNLFPSYYKEYDTYKGSDGKGILERFIEVCSSYLDNDIMPDIDNFMDILDIDKTPDIFLNYFWEYFDYIPYAYGVLVNGTPYTKNEVSNWLNPNNFPSADTRNILKYAVSLYKIRCTEDFYTVLGRFYRVRFELKEILSEDNHISVPNDDNPAVNYRLIGATFDDVVCTYSGENVFYGDFRALYPYGDCTSCVTMKANIYIQKGMYDSIQQANNLENVKKAFIALLNKYNPINVKPFNEDTVELISYIPTIIASETN